MLTSALRSTVAAWARHPRELSAANLVFFLLVAAPLALLHWAGKGPAVALGLGVWALWAWTCFGALAQSVAQILEGAFERRALGRWIARNALERAAALLAAALLVAWVALALRFYLGLGLPLWAVVPVLALLGSLAIWVALALLASVGVAALEAPDRKAVWKASALLPLAYPGTLIATAALGLALSGALLALTGLKHWSAPLLFAPLALSPFITVAFYAAYLVTLVRGLAATASGGGGIHAPSWRELWNPWR